MVKAEPLYVAIGQLIRGAREKAGVTQYELAEMLGCSRPSIQMMERGAQRIHIHTLLAIARALGVDARRLLPHGTFL